MQMLVRDMKVRNEQRRVEMEINIRQAVEERVQMDNEGARENDKFDHGHDSRRERRNFHQEKIDRQRMNKDMGGRKFNESKPNNFKGHDDRNSKPYRNEFNKYDNQRDQGRGQRNFGKTNQRWSNGEKFLKDQNFNEGQR